jgi:hypothetical protein
LLRQCKRRIFASSVAAVRLANLTADKTRSSLRLQFSLSIAHRKSHTNFNQVRDDVPSILSMRAGNRRGCMRGVRCRNPAGAQPVSAIRSAR